MQPKKFDVFISFRGNDTRRTFVSHLWHILERRRLIAFKHEDVVLENQPASCEALQAIEESKIAVAIISENYASSIWCLDELAKIIECKEKGSLQVMPVFYEVDYLDVVRQAGELANDLIRQPENLGKVKRWNDALKSLSQILSHNSREWREDSKMIENIVQDIFRHWFAAEPSMHRTIGEATPNSNWTEELTSTSDLVSMTIQDARDALGTLAGRYIFGGNYVTVEPRPGTSVYGDKYISGNDLARLVPFVSSDFSSLVGMERHMKAIDTLLDIESNDEVREIGIWGAIGVGKTTLAGLVYKQISLHFQDHYYHSINGYFPRSRPKSLLENITRDVMKGDNLALSHNIVKAKLGHRKVLLIVDGLAYGSDLQNITSVAHCFGRGSRLIVVHREKDVLINYCGVRHLYNVESMRIDEALQLFSLFAFKQEYVPRDFDRLCARALFIAGHYPLAVKVLGSFLHGKDVKEWEHELCKLEASQDKWILVVASSYIGGDFYPRQQMNLDQCIGEEGEEDKFPSYCFALG